MTNASKFVDVVAKLIKDSGLYHPVPHHWPLDNCDGYAIEYKIGNMTYAGNIGSWANRNQNDTVRLARYPTTTYNKECENIEVGDIDDPNYDPNAHLIEIVKFLFYYDRENMQIILNMIGDQ